MALEMSLLKHGLLQISETLNFLHNNAHLIHRAISPENVLITSAGSRKLAGFGFAISTAQAGNLDNMQSFHYSEYDVEDSMLPVQPSVNYTAPELDRNDFELITLPALVPVLSTASGDTLLLLVKHAELITNKTDSEHLVSHVLPLLLRAYNDNDVRTQEEVLKRSTSVAKQLDGQVVKQAIFASRSRSRSRIFSEEKRGVTVSDSGIPEVKPHSAANGLQFQSTPKRLRRLLLSQSVTNVWGKQPS